MGKMTGIGNNKYLIKTSSVTSQGAEKNLKTHL